MGWGINAYNLLKIKVKQPCLGYYLRWYYNGWHYWWFLPGKMNVLTSGEKYRTLGMMYIAMSSGQITRGQAQAIRTIENTREIYILTDKGWKALRIEHGSIIIYDNKIAGVEIEFTAVIGNRQLTNTTGYSPIEYVPPPPPVDLVSGAGALYNWWTVQGFYTYPPTIPQSEVMLYNWYAVGDSRNLANTGWHVASKDDYEALMLFYDPAGTHLSNTAANALKESGITHWFPGNAGTNISGLTALGTGYRDTTLNYFSSKAALFLWNAEEMWGQGVISELVFNSNYFLTSVGADIWTTLKGQGYSVRLVKDSTTKTHGDTGTYIGNNGFIYNTICINDREWIVENLSEDHYRNGDLIPEVPNLVDWAALSTGAFCFYNNTP